MFVDFVFSAVEGDLRVRHIEKFPHLIIPFEIDLYTSFSLSSDPYFLKFNSVIKVEPNTPISRYDNTKQRFLVCTKDRFNKYIWIGIGSFPNYAVYISIGLRDYFNSIPYDPNETCGPREETTCPDSDGDGLCDQCDEYPNDPEIGKEVWMKGLYQYDGKTVAIKTSPTNDHDSYDTTSLVPSENGIFNRNFPGYKLDGFGAGGAISIDNDAFVKGGRKLYFADDPYLFTEISCPPVENIDQCKDIECLREPKERLSDHAEDTLDLDAPTDETPYFDIAPNSPETKSEATPEDIAQTEPYFKPIPKPDPNDPVSTDHCSEHRALCINTCGGSRKVSRFACEGTGGKSHVVCECDSKGRYEYAPSFNDIGDDKFTTATSDGDKSTTSNFGSGTGKGYDPDSVGSGTDDLNQDGDPTNDSYSYEEGQVDFSPVQAAYGRITGKFPFNLANSFVDVFRPFANAQGSTPTFTYEVVGHVVRFDLSPFNDFARFIRSMFALGLTLSTILALLYIYVGIDFRRK